MARYWVGGAGTWDTTSTTHWSTTSGGTAGVSAPTSADDVVFDASSGTGTVTFAAATLTCRSFDSSTFAGTLALGNGPTVNIGDSLGGTLTFGTSHGLSGSAQTTIALKSTSNNGGAGWNINYAGRGFSHTILFSGIGGKWIFVSNWTGTNASSSDISITAGTVDFNGYTFAGASFEASGSAVRSAILGASTFNLSNTGGAWNTGTTTNFTFNAGTSTINLTGVAPSLNFGNLTYNVVNATSSSGTTTMIGSATFASLTLSGTGSSTIYTLANNITVTGTFTASGTSRINQVLISSSALGTLRTVTAATVSASNADFRDIRGLGSGSWNFSAQNNIGDALGNSGITFPAPVTQTWAGTTGGNWSANTWTTRIPLSQDDVVIAATFNAGQSVTLDLLRIGKSIDWTGATGNPIFTTSIAGAINVFGSFTLAAGMTLPLGTASWAFCGRGSHTVTLAGATFNNTVYMFAPGGTYTQQDAFTTTINFILYVGTWMTNNFALSCAIFDADQAVTYTRALMLGSSTVTLTSTAAGSVWTTVATSLTMSAASAAIIIVNASASARTFTGSGFSYGILTYTVAGSTGSFTISSSNTFRNINFSDASNARTLIFQSGRIQIITGKFNVFGSPGKLVTINAATTATASTISVSGGWVVLNYASIKDITCTGDAKFIAQNSTNVSGNTGITFGVAESVSQAQL